MRVLCRRIWKPSTSLVSRDGLPSSPGAFLSLLLTMVDSITTLVPINSFTLVTMGQNRLLSFVRDVHSYSSFQRGRLYAHSEDVMVREAGQGVHWTADIYDVDRVNPWRTAGAEDWIVICNVWCRVLGWTDLCVEDEFLARSLSPKIVCIRSSVVAGSLSPVL